MSFRSGELDGDPFGVAADFARDRLRPALVAAGEHDRLTTRGQSFSDGEPNAA